MCAWRQPAWWRWTISRRPWTVSRALPWDTRTSGLEWALDKPHPIRRFSFVQPGTPLPTSWPGTPRSEPYAVCPGAFSCPGHALALPRQSQGASDRLGVTLEVGLHLGVRLPARRDPERLRMRGYEPLAV